MQRQHPVRPQSTSLLARWSRFAARRRWSVLGGWLVVLIAFIALSSAAGGNFVDTFEIPGVPADRELEINEGRQTSLFLWRMKGHEIR